MVGLVYTQLGRVRGVHLRWRLICIEKQDSHQLILVAFLPSVNRYQHIYTPIPYPLPTNHTPYPLFPYPLILTINQHPFIHYRILYCRPTWNCEGPRFFQPAGKMITFCRKRYIYMYIYVCV
jgi:hypothetical protein